MLRTGYDRETLGSSAVMCHESLTNGNDLRVAKLV